jgi:hypothetical protein
VEAVVAMSDPTTLPIPPTQTRLMTTASVTVSMVRIFNICLDIWTNEIFKLGDNYSGPVDQGDQYNGNIHNSTVGGRGNSNHITNYGSSGQGKLNIIYIDMRAHY